MLKAFFLNKKPYILAYRHKTKTKFSAGNRNIPIL
jgi:hypothetical protein